MKLSKISTNVPVQKSADGNLSPSQKELYRWDLESQIPYGKYKDKNLKWVQVNDKGYWEWCLREDMIWKWNLITLKDDAMRPEAGYIKYNKILSSKGEWWVDIREYNQVTTPAPEIWWRG